MDKADKQTKQREAETRTEEASMPEKIEPTNPADQEEEEHDFNFGGLPMRDLKKNLGCG